MPADSPRATALLQRAYDDLGLTGGRLLKAASRPQDDGRHEDWTQLGEWLLLADRAGAERVFFVGEDPVVVFSQLPADAGEADVVETYRRSWSLSRPRCLFLAVGEELRVYSLTAPPQPDAESNASLTPLEVVSRAADVAETLDRFRRERFESGTALEGKEFAGDGRADRQLIRDVRAATAALAAAGLPTALAHTLIERAILVRYLEDRGVLLPGYVREVAQARQEWVELLANSTAQPNVGRASAFPACLGDKGLTYALFERLAEDFNGDLFVDAAGEVERVTDEHLTLLKGLLEGTSSARQETLFLWAYDFSVVPVSLISTMYEVFYQEEVARDISGTHYTPPELVEFVLGRTLTDELLDTEPKICDPACGSGVFLVEAYRVLVRYETTRTGVVPGPERLRTLLLERIAGIDFSEHAVRLAAFSLYLAFLNFQSPQDIRDAGPLPRLIARLGSDHGPLVVADAFTPTLTEAVGGAECAPTLPWPDHHFDVVVGNPPWTQPRSRDIGRAAESWAEARALPVGERSRSQLFLWRSLSLLKRTGTGAILVAATAFLNSRSTTRAFKRQWVERVQLDEVVNFVRARRLFFSKAVAPFMLVRFRATPAQIPDTRFVYLTVARAPALRATGAMGFARLDRRLVSQAALLKRDYAWKVYSWGSHRDEALLARLDYETQVEEVVSTEPKPGWGYQWGSEPPSSRLASLPSLRTFAPWGPLQPQWFEPSPLGVKRQPDERLYEGPRVLVGGGPTAGFGPYARFEDTPLSFRHHIYCLPFADIAPWKAKVVVGILLSRLGRYRLFMTSGSWGVWHDRIYAEDLLRVPVRLKRAEHPATQRIVTLVDALPRASRRSTKTPSLWEQEEPGRVQPDEVLAGLDDAVAELFDLTAAERDLVDDFWAYQGSLRARRDHVPRMPALGPLREGTAANLGELDGSFLGEWLQTFLPIWNEQLGEEGELAFRSVQDEPTRTIAVVCTTRSHDAPLGAVSIGTDDDWRAVLARLGVKLDHHATQRLYVEGIVRAVTDTAIVVVKRAEPRLWTATAAREDTEATLLQALALTPA